MPARAGIQQSPSVRWVGHGVRLTIVRWLPDSPLAQRNDVDRVSVSLLAQHALRVEVADAAALGAGPWIDRRVDEGRLAGVHRQVHRALQFVGCRRMDTDASERLPP